MKKKFFILLSGGVLGLAACGKSQPPPPAAAQGAPGTPRDPANTAPVSTDGTVPIYAELRHAASESASPSAALWNHPVPPKDPNVIELSTASAPPRPLSPRQKTVALAARNMVAAFEAQHQAALAAHAEQLAAWRKRQPELKAQQQRLMAAVAAADAVIAENAAPDAPAPNDPTVDAKVAADRAAVAAKAAANRAAAAAQATVDRATAAAKLESIDRELAAVAPAFADGDPAANQQFEQLTLQFRQACSQNDSARITAISAEIEPLAPKVSQQLFAQYQAEVTRYLQQAEINPVLQPREGPPGFEPGAPPK